ncbi:hypothetical protein D9M69_632420 [compost metagenome]
MGQALDQAGHQQHHGRKGANSFEGGGDADQQAAERRQADGERHGRLAADPVTDPPEHEAAERAGHEADGEDRQGGEEGRRRIRFAEQRAGDERRERGVDRPVVPFNGVADAGADEGPQVGLVNLDLGWHAYGGSHVGLQ